MRKKNKPEYRQINFRTTKRESQQYQALADREARPLSNWIRMQLRTAIARANKSA